MPPRASDRSPFGPQCSRSQANPQAKSIGVEVSRQDKVNEEFGKRIRALESSGPSNDHS